MRFFTKKKSNPNPSFVPPPVEKKCEHKFQDFPWYLTWDIQYNRYMIKVIEPYVYIFCGERRDKVLASYTGTNYKEGDKLLNELRNRFDNHIKYQEEVEDMINDMLPVDPEYLKWYHLLREQQDPSTSRPQAEFNKKPELKL